MPVRTALAAVAALAISIPALRADTAGQNELQQFLPSNKTVATASSKDLLFAVQQAVGLTGTAAVVTPTDLVESALEPDAANKFRTDINQTGPLVAATAVSVLLSGTTAPAVTGTGVASITDAVLDVNQASPKHELDATARATAVKLSLGLVSNAALSNAGLLVADEDIGMTLATDPFLETTLASPALIDILQGGIAGITGLTGKAQAVAPEAAEDFVQGLLASGTVPDALSYPNFAVEILKKVATNASVDELVSYQVGLKDSASDLVNLASTLFAKYTAAGDIVKVTQGVTAVTAAGGTNENARIAFIKSLSTASVKDAVDIDWGASYVDPFYSSQFTSTVFSSIVTGGGNKLAIKDAPTLASGLGELLGQDGNELTQVAEVYAGLTGSNILPVSDSATYAGDLIKGAADSTVPISEFAGAPVFGGGGTVGGGGTLAVTAPTAAIVTDLQGIVDLFAASILDVNGTATSAAVKADAKEIEALVKAVAKFTKSEDFIVSGSNSQPVAVYLAGSVAKEIAALDFSASIQAALFGAITAGVDAEVDKTVRGEVATDVFTDNGFEAYQVVGAVAVQDTTVTNL